MAGRISLLDDQHLKPETRALVERIEQAGDDASVLRELAHRRSSGPGTLLRNGLLCRALPSADSK